MKSLVYSNGMEEDEIFRILESVFGTEDATADTGTHPRRDELVAQTHRHRFRLTEKHTQRETDRHTQTHKTHTDRSKHTQTHTDTHREIHLDVHT